MLIINVRRSSVRWLVPFVLVLGLGVLFVRDRSWIGVWPETSAAAQIPAFLTGSLAAAAAAWSVNAPYRHAIVEQALALPVPRWRRELPAVLAVLIYFGSVSLLIQAAAFVATARSNPPGIGLWPGYVVLGLAMVCLSIAFGHAVGKLLSGRFAAAVAGLSWLMLSMYFGRDLGFAVLTGPVYMRVDLGAITIRLLWALALLGLVVVLPHLAQGSRSFRLDSGWRPVATASLTAGILTVGVVALGHPIVDRQKPADVLCVGTTMQVCLWPEHEKYREVVAGIVRRAEDLPDVFQLPPRVEEYGISYRSININGTVYIDRGDLPPYFYVLNGSKWSVAGSVAREIVNRSIRFCEAPQTKGPQGGLLVTELSTWLEAYLLGGGQPDYNTSRDGEARLAAARGVERANDPSEATQRAWAASQVTKIDELPCR